MIKKYEEIYEAVQNSGQKKTISVAMADDLSVLEAVKAADEKGIAKFLLVGNQEKIKKIAFQTGYDVEDEDIIPTFTDEEIASKSVELVRDGKAEILMKGHISTPILMKAVLNKETGLRIGNVLSHVAVAEVSTYHKLIILSDGGINILPDFQTKIAILNNMVLVANRLGIVKPNIAALCPIEKVNPKIQETVDAAELQKMAEKGELGDIVLEGPIAMDV
ncbi:MAG: phosphate acyltransferase, partial [Candidatus Heimdallarchaeota archaeon]